MIRPFFSLIGIVSIIFLLLSNLCFASDKIFSLSFDPSDLVFEQVEGYDRVKMVGTRFSAEPGSPLLPVRFIQIAIPSDVEVERVEVISFKASELPGTYNLYPAQPFYPVSSLPTKEEEVEFVEPDPSVYAQSGEYPGELARMTNNGFLGGHHIAGVALYPLQYIPAEGKLILYTRIEFKLIFEPSSHSPLPVNRRSQKTAEFYGNLAKSVVINPEAVQVRTKGSLSQGDEIDYLIITDDSFVPAFRELADWKTRRGISTQIKEVSWVLSNYGGWDNPERIRNCIKDYYSNHGTKWILLGGDTPVIPHRVAPVMAEDIPCDFYFSDLDSTWDVNGNHIYGEHHDEVDMYPDVFVGRAPSNDVAQAQTFVEKCLAYETSPTTDYLTRVLYAAEVLWPLTDAALLKDSIDENFLPDHFQSTKLYQTSGNLHRNTFRDGLNAGQNIINHAGHGNYYLLSLGGEAWLTEDMDHLINAPRYSLFYTFGCITAAIDEDCIGEHFVNNPNGGGFGYCGNTRYGWGTPGNPLGGPGAEFDIEFFRAVFDSANYQVGRALGNSKIPFIPIASQPDNVYRWTMYTLLLLGDPTLELWTDTPGELTVSHAPVFFADMSYFDVNVVQDSTLVSCVKDGEVLGTAYSSGGIATVLFDAPLVTMGTMHVTVTKHDFMPYHDTVLVIPPEGPYVIFWSHDIDDSQGNDNGVVNPDETILMPIEVKNIGIEDAYGVSATLRTDDPYAVVTDSVKSFGDIDSGMTAVSIGDYVLEISASCPDSHVVEFDLEASDGDTSWITRFYQMVVEPDFIITAVPDTAMVRQGDSCLVKLVVTSIGGFNWQVDLTYTTLPSGVTGLLNPNQLIPTDSSVFRIYAEPDAPLQVQVITVTASGGNITREKEIVLGVAPPPYYGPLWYVSTDGNDLVGNGTEEFPFRTIQKGIDMAADGDTVLAETGRYVENIHFFGKGILVASHFIFDQLESTISATIIDGNYQGSVVAFDSGEDSTSVIRGFTITRGYKRYGSGVYCHLSSPTIVENFIVRDSAEWGWSGGAGVYCWDSSPKIYRNVVAENFGPCAVFLYGDSYAEVVNNTICNNAWGGLSVQNSAVYAKNNIFYGNVSYGIHISNSDWDISYNDVYGQEENYAGIDDQTGVNGNISADPLFEDPWWNNYHLTSASPCVDAGDPADSVPAGGGARIDMGAFEYQQGPDFTMTAVPDSVLIPAADSASIKLLLTSYNGFSSPVDLSYSELPSGVTGSIEPDQVIPTDSSIFRICATEGVSQGLYPVSVTASGGDRIHHKYVRLDIRTYFGPVWYVSTSGDDETGEGSEGSPFRTIQKAIAFTASGDTVLVERGAYAENINFCGKAILVGSHYIIDGLESTIESTVIDGLNRASVVTFNSGEDSNSVIRGFTLTGGLAEYGAGIYCQNSSPTIEDNFVLVNRTSDWGGGPGIYCAQSSATIRRNVISGCSGAATIWLMDASGVRITNNTVCGNDEGGLSIQGSTACVKNNILYGNADYGIHFADGEYEISYNDVFWHDGNYSGMPDQTGVNGNISSDPLFVSYSGGDYHLTVNSPCRDAGDPADSVPPGGGDRIDMGAFEYPMIGPDFSMTVVPDTAIVEPGDSTQIKLILTSFFGFDSTVSLSCFELPDGVTGVFEPDQVVPTDSSILRISTTFSVAPGTYPIVISATGGGVTHEKRAALILAPPPYGGPVWHVSTSGNDSPAFGNGSETYPFRTIQKAINAAEHGDTVLVGKGRYWEGPNFLGKRILVASHFIFDGLESTIDATIIDGDGVGPVVSFVSGEDSNSVIRGFTITGGNTGNGGAIYCILSSPTIADNFIVENTANGGPAIYCQYSNCSLYRNLIANCYGPATIWLAHVCSTRMVNNTICHNDGGALSIQSRSMAYVRNCIFYRNGPYGIHAASICSAEVLYSDVFLHDENYAGVIEDQTGINGNISADPSFVDTSAGNYHLSELSPCVDAGDPADSVPLGGGDRIDMGVFECMIVPEFTIAAIPDTAVVRQGDSTAIKLILKSYGFSSPVDLSFSELPPGVSGFLNPDQLVPTDSSVFTVHAEPDAPIGGYPVTVTAEGGDVIREAEFALYVGVPWSERTLWHVSVSGHDYIGNGSSQHPFRAIQRGINSTSHGDTVLVNSGLYKENIDFRGKAILVASRFILDGSQHTITSTVIDGNRQGSVVTFNSGEDSASVIRGFTITGGHAQHGGGIYCCGSSPVIADNFVVNDSSDSGNGPGIYCKESSAKIRRNVVGRCHGYGAVTLYQVADVQLVNNTICDNSWGGLSGQGGLIQGKNNILYANTAYGIHSAGSTWDLSYNDVYANDNNYVGIADQTGINGNISADPLFMNSSSGDYRLTGSSPCIDVGDPVDSVPPGGGARIDMGAFEYPYEFVNGDANGDGVVAANDVVYLVNYLFRDGSPPYPMQAGDANHDGDVNAADIVYLIQYLYRGGPPPGEGDSEAQVTLARGAQPSARIWLSDAKSPQAEKTVEIFVRGSFDLDIAAVQLAIQYDPQNLSLSPALSSNLQALQVFSRQEAGVLKAGVLDLKGESWIPAGRRVDILVIQIEGANLGSLRIKEAILADRNGYVVPVKIVTEEEVQEPRPESFSLSQNYPNPFNPQTQISYALPKDCDVKITVYNLLGQRVKVLIDRHQMAGYKRVNWDGYNEQGVEVASGVYFYEIRAADFKQTKKMLLLK